MSAGWNSPIVETINDWVKQQADAGEAPEGKGQPLELDDYFATPEDRRVGYALLKSNGFCPAEVELLRRVRALESRLASVVGGAGVRSDDEVTQWRRELSEALAKLGWQSPRR